VQIYLVPLDATNQVVLTGQDTLQWRHGGQAANSAADMYDMLLKSSSSMEAWDLMTAAIMLDPSLCDFQPLHLTVITEDGASQGQTFSRGSADPNVQVCLHPHPDAIRQTLAWVFSNSK
jgi:inosine-uridine nucleoside N-ribohydrolase